MKKTRRTDLLRTSSFPPTDSGRLLHGGLTHRQRSRTLPRASVCLLGSSWADSSTKDTCLIPTATISS